MARIKLSKGMGRRDDVLTGKCRLQRLSLDSGGYDSGGAYWGLGRPLYVAEDKEGNQFFVRADDREEAKDKILKSYIPKHKDVSFYR